MGILIPLILVTLSSLVIWRATDAFETASDYLGRNLSDGVKGATINAIASSMPELFTSLFFLFYLHDSDGFSGGIGTTAGSAVFNGMIIPALAILVVIYSGVTKNITLSLKVMRRDGISLILAELILIMLISGSSLEWWHGLVLMGIYVIYITYMLTTMSKGEKMDHEEYNAQKGGGEDEDDDEDEKPKSLVKSSFTIDLEHIVLRDNQIKGSNAWPLLIISTVVIAISCYFLVLACEWIGADTYTVPFLGTYNGLDIPVMFVALILAAAASSIPDTIISMKDSKKGNYDDAVSNAIGSNMFDICFALGFPLFLYTMVNGPIVMDEETIRLTSELRMMLLIFTVATVLVFISGKTIGKIKAYLLISMYVLFIIYVVGRNNEHPVAMSIAEFLRSMVNAISLAA